MAASSPYSGNDYNAISTYRPYQLPVNDIFKALAAQNEFWEQGARRVKSVYDNALNLKLTNVQNKQIRDQFMQDAEKEITKLSAMDLSDPSVQRQGFGIFQPLFKDEGIISDDAATRHIDKVNSEALSYMRKDNGKYYNQMNHQYALDGADEFRNSQDRMAGKAYLERAKNFEPYYDYTAEYDKALKNCPSDSTGTDSVLSESGYIQSTSIKGRSAAKVRTCLEANLSPKAYRQMQIEGYMSYKGRPEVLKNDYIEFLSGSGETLSGEIQSLSGRLEGINADKNLKAEEKAAITEQITAQIDGLRNELTNTTATVNKLNAGDYSPIAGNEELISGNLYQYRKMLKASYAAAFQEYKSSFKADPVSMQRFKYEQDVNLRALDFKHDVILGQIDHNYDIDLANINNQNAIELENLKQMSKGVGAAGSNAAVIWDAVTKQYVPNPKLDAVAANYTETPGETAPGFTAIKEQLATLNSQKTSNDDYLFNSFITKAEQDPAFKERLQKAFNTTFENIKRNSNKFSSNGNIVKFHETEWFKNYVKGNASDPDVQKWNVVNAQNSIGIQALNTQLENSEAQVISRLGLERLRKEGGGLETPEDAIYRNLLDKVKDIKPITENGVQYTPEDILNLSLGIPTKGLSLTGSGKVLVNGRDNWKLSNMYTDMKNKGQFKDFKEKVNEVRKDIYEQIEFKNEPWFFSIDNESNTAQQWQSAFKTADEDGKKRGVAIEQLNFEGGYKVRIPGLTDDEFKRAQALGASKDLITRDPKDPDVLQVKGTNYNNLPSVQMNPGMKNTAYILSTIAKGSEFAAIRPGQAMPGGSLQFPILDTFGEQRVLKVQIRKDVDGSPLFDIVDSKDNKVLANNMKEPFAVMKYLEKINLAR